MLRFRFVQFVLCLLQRRLIAKEFFENSTFHKADAGQILQNVETTLTEQLLLVTPDRLPAFLSQHESELILSKRPFTDYMRRTLREKRILQQDIFLAADLSERYGYKLISGEKHTLQRDVILRICLASEFQLEEVQEALTLYGMAALHARIPRDCAFIVAFSNRIYDIHNVDAILRKNKLPPFLTPEQISNCS